MTEEHKLVAGEIVERYTVEGKIGKGGVARVYKVRHNTLGSHHALKVLRVHGNHMRERLVQEGQVQASLRHVNVVAVTDVVDIAGSPGLVMDYIEGPSLDHWLRANRPDLAQAEAIFRGIVAGVGRAHRLGLVHRDLKPANVLLATDEDGTLVPKVADFGLAKILSGDSATDSDAHTRSGTTMGTPAYMAPEQVRDTKSVDQRADIFALGCILYELCTGASPFYHPDLFAIFSALASGRYTSPQALVPDLPPRIDNTIRGCLAVQRDDRIQSCSVLLQVLDGAGGPDWSSLTFTDERPSVAVSAAPVSVAPAVPSPPPALAERPAGRWRWVGGLAVAGVAAVVVVGVVLLVGLVAGALGWSRFAATPDPTTVPAPVVVAPAPPSAPAPEVPVPVVAPVVPAPVVAAPRPPPAPAPVSPATVSATGDADQVWLEGPGGRVELGVVPPGEYRIQASFKGQAAQPAGRVTVRADQTVVLSCSAAFQMCQAR